MPAAVRYSVASDDGTRIAVHRSGAGPPLVLVHGTTADHTRWVRVAPEFARHFTVHAMDRRGRGGSGDSDAYSIEREAEDIVAVAVQAGDDVTVLGHSYGGLCCLEAALQIPALRRLVLYEPPLPVGLPIATPELEAELEALIQRDEREEALLAFFRGVVKAPEEQLAVMKEHPAWPGRVAAAHTLVRETRVEGTYRFDVERLRGLKVPTLLLMGSDSPAFLREPTLRLNALIPNSRIHEMAGQQHGAMDMISAEFVRIVTTFVLGEIRMQHDGSGP